jgi:hypothetical protein
MDRNALIATLYAWARSDWDAVCVAALEKIAKAIAECA